MSNDECIIVKIGELFQAKTHRPPLNFLISLNLHNILLDLFFTTFDPVVSHVYNRGILH